MSCRTSLLAASVILGLAFAGPALAGGARPELAVGQAWLFKIPEGLKYAPLGHIHILKSTVAYVYLRDLNHNEGYVRLIIHPDSVRTSATEIVRNAVLPGKPLVVHRLSCGDLSSVGACLEHLDNRLTNGHRRLRSIQPSWPPE